MHALKMWYLRSQWRRHPKMVLYHVILFAFMVVTVVHMMGNPWHGDETNEEKRHLPVSQGRTRLRSRSAGGILPKVNTLVEEIVDLKSRNEEGDEMNDMMDLIGDGRALQHVMKKNTDSKPDDSLIPNVRYLRQRKRPIISGTIRRDDGSADLQVERPDPAGDGDVNAHYKEETDPRPQKSEQEVFQNTNVDLIEENIHIAHYNKHVIIHQKPSSRVNVLLVAAMRTGSSFLGELFQQRNDFFYMFEPGMLLMHRLDSLNLTRRVMVSKLIQMFGNFYHCKFNGMRFFVDELNRITLYGRKQAVPALINRKYCRLDRKPKGRPKDACEPVTEQALETVCLARANTAIKSIRILDINLMLPLIQEPDVNLKLIHLIRDPRSMIISRIKLILPGIQVYNVTDLTDTHRNILIKYCSNWLQNIEIGHYVPFFRHNYLLVRYEDLALEPYAMAEKIYAYLGLGATIPQNVHVWLSQNTNVNDPSKKKSAAFSTKRDSKAVLTSWKSRVTLDMVKAIEGVGDCRRLMLAAGYRLIGDDESSLLNSTDNLIDPLPNLTQNTSVYDFLL